VKLYFVLASDASTISHRVRRAFLDAELFDDGPSQGAGGGGIPERRTDRSPPIPIITWVGPDGVGARVFRLDSDWSWPALLTALESAADYDSQTADWARIGRALRIDLVRQAAASTDRAAIVVLTDDQSEAVTSAAYFDHLNDHLDLDVLSPRRIVVVEEESATNDDGLGDWELVAWADLSPALNQLVKEPGHINVADVEDDDVQFTVYRPRMVPPRAWHDLLFFAHKTDMVNGESGPINPLAEVAQQASRLLGSDIDDHLVTHTDAAASLPRGRTITVIPDVPSTTFNPPRRSFVWNEPVHRERFRFRTEADIGTAVNGVILVLLGSVVIGSVSIRLRIGQTADVEPSIDRAEIYRRVFVSYSHDDVAVVDRVTEANTMGDQFIVDRRDLRVGQDWQAAVRGLIQKADVFQLFWSTNAMQSRNVEVEWRYALSLDRPAEFIRTVYWERPIPRDESRSLPPPELTRRHFHHLSLSSTTQTAGVETDPVPAPYAPAPSPPSSPGSAAPTPPPPAPPPPTRSPGGPASAPPSPRPAGPAPPPPAPPPPGAKTPRVDTGEADDGRRRGRPGILAVAVVVFVSFLAGVYSCGSRGDETSATTLSTADPSPDLRSASVDIGPFLHLPGEDGRVTSAGASVR
jgi:hypothetical protein